MSSEYIDWLKKQNFPLFEGGGIYWRLYRGALIPATPSPCFVHLRRDEAKRLLQESGAWFLRYSSDPCEEKREWWYIICDSCNLDRFPSKIRSMIKRGNRSCEVRQIDAEWLAAYGYDTYLAAFGRYKNAKPASEVGFRDSIATKIDGPFEHWGVFVGDRLAGYCECIIENNNVSMDVIKYHPELLQYYTSYALVSNMITHYVIKKRMTISNGTRSILHDTKFQEFLFKLGFRKQFCKLNVVYPPFIKTALQILFPLSPLISKLPDRGAVHKLQGLFYQEELRRACSAR